MMNDTTRTNSMMITTVNGKNIKHQHTANATTTTTTSPSILRFMHKKYCELDFSFVIKILIPFCFITSNRMLCFFGRQMCVTDWNWVQNSGIKFNWNPNTSRIRMHTHNTLGEKNIACEKKMWYEKWLKSLFSFCCYCYFFYKIYLFFL